MPLVAGMVTFEMYVAKPVAKKAVLTVSLVGMTMITWKSAGPVAMAIEEATAEEMVKSVRALAAVVI